MSAARRKSSGTSAATPAQKSAANSGRVAIDRAQFAEIFRQLAAKSQRAAKESAAVARACALAADKLESEPVANPPPRGTRKGTVTT